MDRKMRDTIIYFILFSYIFIVIAGIFNKIWELISWNRATDIIGGILIIIVIGPLTYRLVEIIFKSIEAIIKYIKKKWWG